LTRQQQRSIRWLSLLVVCELLICAELGRMLRSEIGIPKHAHLARSAVAPQAARPNPIPAPPSQKSAPLAIGGTSRLLSETENDRLSAYNKVYKSSDVSDANLIRGSLALRIKYAGLKKKLQIDDAHYASLLSALDEAENAGADLNEAFQKEAAAHKSEGLQVDGPALAKATLSAIELEVTQKIESAVGKEKVRDVLDYRENIGYYMAAEELDQLTSSTEVLNDSQRDKLISILRESAAKNQGDATALLALPGDLAQFQKDGYGFIYLSTDQALVRPDGSIDANLSINAVDIEKVKSFLSPIQVTALETMLNTAKAGKLIARDSLSGH